MSARRPSIRAGASPVSAAISRASFTALASAAGSTLRPARGFLRLDGQRDLEIAAPEALGRQHARRRLQRIEARRHAQPQIQAAAIDAFGLPAPAQPVMAAALSAKPVMLTMVMRNSEATEI